eukprot:CAMPEP_0202447632 /NCGR_PEP_ID=MMETSP1360-20130828/6407_1 /ASSEMBLY_ACC=CAM_ASM_000848 /TAXON_ID=515479 /ORGANISM="Licmophora paradoxa, Strain CCMP2313" /LENGTH=225 /DNA_ID=CAMNT_0049064821 /DNA_START=69 /DNA_END=743 /DNA_ORIENTATION=+
MFRFLALIVVSCQTSVSGFIAPTSSLHKYRFDTSTSFLRETEGTTEEASEEAIEKAIERSNVDKFLQLKYPDFYQLIVKNDELGKILQSSDPVLTVFAPTAQAFQDLGEKKLQQLADPRNLETVQKIAAYHVAVNKSVPASRLFQEDWTVPKTDTGNRELSYSGIKTLGGQVAVGRTKSGGFLGLFAQEDGGVVIGPEGKITQSFSVGKSFVHETNAFVSPQILW